jgi:hypothetical protein
MNADSSNPSRRRMLSRATAAPEPAARIRIGPQERGRLSAASVTTACGGARIGASLRLALKTSLLLRNAPTAQR